uniref:HAT C-terminal dimerisation domain-containing protein n=1 Tax=Octopus bimaculoides TaxID=37653 RepID=A0A0L8H619_OCTBM
MGSFCFDIASGLKTSYKISKKSLPQKKPHNIGEQLILPCCRMIILNVFSQSELSKLKHISLSNDTNNRQIAEISENILSQVVAKIKNSTFNFFSIQLDESTDIANMAQLYIFVRYIHNKSMEDNFLFCKSLHSKTTTKDILVKVDNFFHAHDINWEHCIGVCTDGTPVMLGCCSGFQTLIKQKALNALGTHCTIHRQDLMAKTLPDTLKNVLNDVIAVVNFIKAGALNSHLFAYLCRLNDADFETLLLVSHVRWLSKGKVLMQVLLLRNKINEFIQDLKSLLHCHEKISAFKMKLELWASKLQEKNFAPLPQLNKFIDENEFLVNDDKVEVMQNHICILREELSLYFLNLQNFEQVYCFMNFIAPFSISLADLPSEDITVQEQFIELLNDGAAKQIFCEMSCDFWIQVAQLYPDISKMALKYLVPFTTTYECELAFSALQSIKSKQRNRLDFTYDMRVALSRTQPNIDNLVKLKQIQQSH